MNSWKNCKKNQMIVAICGRKNSGKTTLITKLIPVFKHRGFKVATIKHDGHDFEADTKGTDTFRHKESGAYGTAIFSNNKWMIVKDEKTKEDELIELFPEADVILLEGFKYSTYPKIEVVREDISNESICNKENLILIAADIININAYYKIVDINNIDLIANEILKYFEIL